MSRFTKSNSKIDPKKFLGKGSGDLEKRVGNNEKKITLLKNIIKAQQITIGEHLQSLESVKNPLDESIKSITDSVTSIHQALIDQQEFDKDQQDDIAIDVEQDARDDKETDLEDVSSVGEGLKKTGMKMLKPVTNIFDSIKNWLFKFFAAKAIMMFMKWFGDPANKKKVATLFRFIKDWWPSILTAILLFAGSMLGPGGIIIGVTALVVGFIPKITNSIKQLFGFTRDVNKEAAKGEKEADKALKGDDSSKEGYDKWRANYDASDTTINGLKEGDAGFEEALKAKHQKAQKEGPSTGFNKGGQVPGQGDKDTVPAMLTPGEFVMSKGAVEQYGVDTLEGMNAAAGGTNKPKEIKPGFTGSNLPGYGGGGSIQSNKLFGYSGGGEVVEEKKKSGPKLNKTTGKLARRIEPLITGQPQGLGAVGSAVGGALKGFADFMSGLAGSKKEEPDLDLKEAIVDLQNRFNYSIYDGNYKMGGVVGSKGADGSQGSAGASGGILDGFISAVSSLPIVGKPLAKASGLLVTGVEQMIDQKLQLSGLSLIHI